MSIKPNHWLNEEDAVLNQLIEQEYVRQKSHLELIASENYASPAVMAAQGSVLTNKYAEGYPGRRYYGGCEYVDQVEDLAIERLKSLYKASYANVQPHSGSQANAVAYMALAEPGDTILAMSLEHGGHLTHGSQVNFSGKYFNFIHYGVNSESGLIDESEVEVLARKHRPKVIVAGFSAYSRVVDWAKFRQIADQVGAYLMVDMAHVSGLVAGGVYPSPVPHAHVVTSTTHKTLRGPRGGIILSQDEVLHKKINSALFPGIQGGPLLHVIAAKAVAFREAQSESFHQYQAQVLANARAMVDILQQRDLPVISGGTDNHLLLIDVRAMNITGKEAEAALGLAHMVVNKNMIPSDPNSPWVTSGIRIGTPAMTSRGCGTEQAELVAEWICDILSACESGDVRLSVQQKVQALCEEFPIYPAGVV